MLPSNRRRDSSQNSNSIGKTNSTRTFPCTVHCTLFQGHGHRRARKNTSREEDTKRIETRHAQQMRTTTNENKHTDALQRRPDRCNQVKRRFRREGKQSRREGPWQTLEERQANRHRKTFFSDAAHRGKDGRRRGSRRFQQSFAFCIVPRHRVAAFLWPAFCVPGG